VITAAKKALGKKKIKMEDQIKNPDLHKKLDP
jgi:hypothetical protein